MRRGDFPLLSSNSLIYFDTAATCQKPQVVIDAISRFYSSEYGTVHRAIYTLAAASTEKYDGVRQKVATFLNAASAREIVFTRGTTDSINLVAQSYGECIEEGDEIIISEMEHHSNIVPWQLLCERKKARLKVIRITDDAELDLVHFATLLSSKTKLVAIGHVANSTGTVNPIKKITEMAHSYGAKVLIDGAQAIAHIPVDVEELDVDFYAFSGHKAFGPTGVGILYGKYSLLEKMPPVQGGGDMIEKVTLSKTTYGEPPLRFEAGTPMIAQVIGLGAAIDYIESIGRKNIHNSEQKLLTYATEKLLQIPGLRIIGTAKEKGAIIAFVIDGIHPLDLGTLLNLKGIAIRTGHHCAQPLLDRFGLESTCRISFAPYNTTSEIDCFTTALLDILPLIRH